MRWADEGDGQHGFGLLNNSKYGYDAVGNQLRLTLLRSPVYPDPDADRGDQKFEYALYPHAGAWQSSQVMQRGYEFNYGVQAMQVADHEGALPAMHSFASVGEPAGASHVVLTALKKAEDGHALVARFYEWAGKGGDVTLTVPAGVKSAEVVNLMEQETGQSVPVEAAAGESVVKVPVTPYMIQTVRLNY